MNKIILLLFISISTLSFAQTDTKVDLSNPNATIYTHLHFLQKDTFEPSKAAQTIYGLEGEEAMVKAIKLKEIFDGKGLFVDFTKVPNNPKFSDTTAYKIGNHYVLFPLKLPQVSVDKYGDKWLYSRETVSIIDKLYKETFPWQTKWLKNRVSKIGTGALFGIELWQYTGLLGLLLFGVLFFYIFKIVFFFILQKIKNLFTNQSSHKITLILRKLARPFVFLSLIYVFEKIIPSLQLGLTVNTFLFLAFDISRIVFWIYVFLKIVKIVMSIYKEHTQRTHIKLDNQLVPILTHFLTGIVVFLGLLKLLTLFGISATSVIAGASIGGLALALASQDTVKNLIGTFMIFLDKPFHIGDWIETSELKGTVEEVGFRSSRIRAADTSIYQIPNSTLSEIVINNLGLRLYRRYQTELGIRYDTPPELIDAFIEGLNQLIKAHPQTKKDSFDVAFSGFGDSALNIMFNIYFIVNTWSDEQQAKHNLHIAIVKLAKVLGIEFAFSSTTVIIEQFPEKQTILMNYEDKNNQNLIESIITDLKNSTTKSKENLESLDEED